MREIRRLRSPAGVALAVLAALAIAPALMNPVWSIELAYDDGDPDGGVLLAPGQVAAVRMTPPAGTWLVAGARYYIYQGEGKVRVLASENGSPGSDLLTPFSIVPTTIGWYDVDLRAYGVTVSGEFFVGIEGVDQYTACSIGHDFLSGGNGRAWNYLPSTGWEADSGTTYFVRAVLTSAGGTSEAPTGQALGTHCLPGIFSGSTRVQYELAAPGHVEISVWDCSGRRVRVLLDADQAAGAHRVVWDGRTDAGTAVSPGVFFVRVSTGPTTRTLKLILL